MSKNLHRRHLSETQRAAVAAKLATLPRGANQHRTEGPSIDASYSRDEAAEMLNVGRASVDRAKTVYRDGTPEEIEKMETGEAALDARFDLCPNGSGSTRCGNTEPTLTINPAVGGPRPMAPTEIADLPRSPTRRNLGRDRCLHDANSSPLPARPARR